MSTTRPVRIGSGLSGSVREAGDRVVRTVAGVVNAVESVATAGVRDATALLSGPSTCQRPPACWLPDQRPAITAVVCGCGTATVRVAVRNCGLAERIVFLAATGPDAGLAVGGPASASIGAFETAELVAEVTLPSDVDRAELILWVRGCHDTAVPWAITTSDRGADTTHELQVEDCPDTQHHWYDHFAHAKPCRTSERDG